MESARVSDPRQITGPYNWDGLCKLIQSEFAYMQGRIDPPSSMHRLTPDRVAQQAQTGEIWVIETPPARPVASVFLTPQPPSLYLHKLTVAFAHRGQGLARRLVALAETRARALGLADLTLQSRVELTENHAAFTALGFSMIGTRAHSGFSRPTSITMQRPVGD